MEDLLSARGEKAPLLTPLNLNKNADLNMEPHFLDRSLSADSLSEAFAERLERGSEQRANSSDYRIARESPRLDHTMSSWSIVSYVVTFLLLIVVPIFKLLFVKAATGIPRRQLAYQPVVAFVEVSRSIGSSVFLSQAFREHGLHGFLFRLDSVAAEVAQIWTEYDTVNQLGGRRFIPVFVPSLILYLAHSLWLYSTVDLKPMPFTTHHPLLEVVFVLLMTTLSWMFQTIIYLYACVLFWNVCENQELKMRKLYLQMLNGGLETEYFVWEYERIKGHLKDTSHRFRVFLAFTGVISVSAALISMYEAVHSINDGLSLCLWGDLIVLSVVNLTGAWQCLRSASKIARLQRRIRRTAASLHASWLIRERASSKQDTNTLDPFRPRDPRQHPSEWLASWSPRESDTIAQSPPSSLSKISEGTGSNQPILGKLEKYCRRQEAWIRRAAVVEYLQDDDAGISVYGLDRLFVHTCIGAALLATPWFILVRNLQG